MSADAPRAGCCELCDERIARRRPTEKLLAQREERSEAIDRIAARHPELDAQAIVAMIRDGLEAEIAAVRADKAAR